MERARVHVDPEMLASAIGVVSIMIEIVELLCGCQGKVCIGHLGTYIDGECLAIDS
jgi:hypothetical protein